MEAPPGPEKWPSASLLRLFIVIFYDSLLLFSVLFLAAALAYPVTDGQVSLSYQIYLLTVGFLYFAWSWLRGGQTLGMKAWRIQLVSSDGKPLTWQQALLRFSMAIVSWLALGMGFFWALVDKQRRTWHDWASNTRMVLRPKPSKRK
jgi:uncharacterized RDD family membrane protein YckC